MKAAIPTASNTITITHGTRSSRHGHYHDFDLGPNARTEIQDKRESNPSGRPERDRFEYKPTSLRRPFLILLLAALLATLLLLSYAVYSLPTMETYMEQPLGGLEARVLNTMTGFPVENVQVTTITPDTTRPSQSLQSNTLATILIPSITTTAVDKALRAAPMVKEGASLTQTFTTELEPRNICTTDTIQVISTVWVTLASEECQVVTITTTATDNTQSSGHYGQIGYQTVIETFTWVATETVTETIKETIKETITETMLPQPPQPPQPASSSKPPGGYDDVEEGTTVTKSLASASLSVPRGDLGDISDKTDIKSSSLTPPTIASSRSANDAGGVDHQITRESKSSTSSLVNISELTKLQGDSVDIGDKTVSATGVDSTTPLTHLESIETKNAIGNPLYYTTKKGIDANTITDPYVTKIAVVLTDAQGSPTSTSTTQVSVFATKAGGGFGRVEDKIITLGVTTLTDAMGSPVATLTMLPNPVPSLATITLTDVGGRPTATQVWTVLITPSLSVETDSRGNPTATITSYPIPPTTHTVVYYISPGQYFVGKFLPTAIASFIAILVRTLSTNAKIFQPWHALTHDRGAFGRDSICLQTGGWQSIVMSVRSLSSGEAVVFLANILLLSSAVLVPISAEAIALDLRGNGCKKGASTAKGCAWVLSASAPASKATIALLVLMSVTVILLIVLLRMWRLGVYTNPRSICTIASLLLNQEARQLVAGTKMSLSEQDKNFVKDSNFKLGHFQHINGRREYGIIALDDLNGAEFRDQHKSRSETVPVNSRLENNGPSKSQHYVPFFMLRCLGRLVLLFTVCSVLVLVLYYSQTGGDTAFERFLDSDSFGVRFLFTSFGVVISFFWSSFFDSK